MTTTTSLEQITSWSQLAGKTIRCAIDSPSGEKHHVVNAILVFEDQSWAAICGENEGEDGTHVGLRPWYGGSSADITLYLSPAELFAADLINKGQHDLLVERANQRERERAEKEAARLRNRLAALSPMLSEDATAMAIREAADLIEREAQGLADGHTHDGTWPAHEVEAKAAYDEMLAKAAALRGLLTAAPKEAA